MTQNTNILKKLENILSFRDTYEYQIDQYINQIDEDRSVEEDQLQKIIEGRDINVVIRARPLLGHELNAGYFNIVHAYNKKFFFLEPKINLTG